VSDSIWTSEPPEKRGWYWRDGWRDSKGKVHACRDIEDQIEREDISTPRSILPVPSAERHAALERVAEAARYYREALVRDIAIETLETGAICNEARRALFDALAALEAAP